MGQVSNKMHHLSRFQHNWTGGDGVTDIYPAYSTPIGQHPATL